MTLVKSNRRKRRLPYLLIISLLMLIASGFLFIIELNNFAGREDRLPAGITAGEINVGGFNDQAAASSILETYTSPITLYYRNAPINLNPETIGFEVNTQVMIAEARRAGETEGGFWARFLSYLLGREQVATRNIPLEFSYQRNALRTRLQEIATIYDRPAGSASYDLQTLTIEQGETGYEMDIDAAVTAVEEALQRPDSRYVTLPVSGGDEATRDMTVLREMITAYLDAQGFIYDGQSSVASIFIMDLKTGEEINLLGDVAFTAASTSKVGIMIDFFRELDREPNRDEAFLMANSLLCSANSSSNRIMELYLGGNNIFSGLASVTETFQYLVDNTYITAPFVDGSAGQQLGTIEIPETTPNPNFNTGPDRFNQTTAEDMGTLFAMMYDCANYGSGLQAAYPDDITQRECQQMLELTSANDLNRLLQGGIPAGTRIAHKNGWIGEITGDAGVVYPPNGRDYVISVFLWEDRGSDGFQDYVRLWPLIEDISRATWNYFSPENALPQRRSDLPLTAQECYTLDNSGNIDNYNYLPPYNQIDLNNINGWRDGTPTTPQPLPGEETTGSS